ncbi:MAG TPA: DUF3306 domain-containing protein [Burkholderiales bacterium]
MSADDKEPFLSRWSRRKLQTDKESATAKPVAAPQSAPAAAPAKPQPELPSIDSLQGLASEYQEFLRPEVDVKLRQAALKKLFHDPHFNIMDGLDTYIDDYSKPDPIPEEMLKSLKQANRLLFPEEAAERDKEIEAQTAKTAVPAVEAPPALAADDKRAAREPESPPAQDSKLPAKPA